MPSKRIKMTQENAIEIFKALSNETRLNILKWLKNPDEHFPPQGTHLEGVNLDGAVCVDSLQKMLNISQSTTSQYLSQLQRAGLLYAQRHGKWTYYGRNEETITKLAEYIKIEI